MPNWNESIIEEFRANEGRVGGGFQGAPLLILTTTGAKSGRSHLTPVMYLPDGERFIVIASKGGSPSNPDWYHNLLANPKARVEVGTETFDVAATVLTGEERDRLYAEQAHLYPGFKEYQEKTSRLIPVIALERIG